MELWRPGAGYLFSLDVEVLGPGDEFVDVYVQPFGAEETGRLCEGRRARCSREVCTGWPV